MTLLTGRCRLSRREARDIAVALFGPKARVSLGTVAAMERRTSKALRPAYDEALDAIQSADFVHADETSWRESNKLAWLWSAVTPKLKVFRIDARRNREAFRKLLFTFEGILVTDRFSVYRAHDTGKRQLCWAHVLRNFRGLEERGGKARSLGVSGQKDRQGRLPGMVPLPGGRDHEARAPAQARATSQTAETPAPTPRQQPGAIGAGPRHRPARIRRGTPPKRANTSSISSAAPGARSSPHSSSNGARF
jgi:hypothetical protein